MPPTAPPRCPPGPFYLAAALLASPAAAQAPDAALLATERAAYKAWLDSAPGAPSAAVAHREVGAGVTIGDGAVDLALPGIGTGRLTVERNVVFLEEGGSRKPLARGRPVSLGAMTLVVGGTRERPMVTLFDPARPRATTDWYPVREGVRFVGPLQPPEREGRVPLLTFDGVQVEATEAGTVRVPIDGREVTLRVRRVPNPGSGESELEIYFQDPTNQAGSYPSGRFVTLDPLGDGRYRLDFNRARNPFCAYSTAYPCPVPWAGNRIEQSLEAGERYLPPPGTKAP